MTIPRTRPFAGLLALIAASVLTAVLALATADVAGARASFTSCDISSVADRLGPTSVTSLKVSHLRCGRGISVVRAFQSCRLANGESGRCVRLVARGYACSEIRSNGPTQFTATATCKKDRATVVHRYTQALTTP
jgi:beta-lactamase class A